MISMVVNLEGGGAYPELQGKTIHHVTDGMKVSALKGGMESGAPSVHFVIPLEDGSVVFLETSMRLFLAAAEAFKARYGGQL